MKTINIASSLLVMAAAFTSCSDTYDELPAVDSQEEITASFSISVPAEAGTRSDANVAENSYTLEWTVFDMTDSENPKIFTSGKKSIESLSASQTIEVRLIKEMIYKITFCAYDSTHQSFARYDKGKVRINYAEAKSIQIGDDLFTGFTETFMATKEIYKKSVVLRRPFAQLNWGSSDLEAITVAPCLKGTSASVTVGSGLYQTLDLLTGKYSDPMDGEFTFRAFDCGDLPKVEHGIPMYQDQYRLLASNLLLVGDSPVAVNCRLAFSGNVEVVAMVANVPLEKNFRTNIYGGLITNPASINLAINEYFEKSNDVTEF